MAALSSREIVALLSFAVCLQVDIHVKKKFCYSLAWPFNFVLPASFSIGGLHYRGLDFGT